MTTTFLRVATVTATLAGLGAALAPTPARAAPTDPDPAAVERYVTAYLKRAGYPGVSIAITRGDKVLLTAGYGHDSSGARMTARTPMPAASLSKSFTALAVMRLVEAKKVELDAPVRSYLPEFEIADRRGSKITVRHLLNHTSGITDGTHPEKSLPQPDSLAGAVRRARTASLAAEPGTAYFYTNTNAHIAARLVEVVAGEPFAGHLRREVLEPIGMRSSGTFDAAPDDLPAGLHRGHIYAYGASIPTAEPHRFLNGSDGLITTADDLAQWLVLHNNGGTAANGTRLVTPETVTAMHTPSDPGRTYGLGWDIDPAGRVNHTGIWFTFTACQLLLPGGYGIAVLSNSGIGLGNEGTSQLADGLATILAGDTPSPGAPMRLGIDLVLAVLTLLSIGLGLRAVRRAPVWAGRLAGRPLWAVVRLLPRSAPIVVLAVLPKTLGNLVGGGRDLTHVQLAHYSVALTLWLAVAAVTGLTVIAVRLRALLRVRRAAPVRDASVLVTTAL